MTQVELLRQEQLKKQLAEQKLQSALDKKNKKSMNTPFSISIIQMAVNGIKKTNDYILDEKIRKQIDLFVKHLNELKNKGVTSIDGITFMKTRKPKNVRRNIIAEKQSALGWVKNGCVKNFLAHDVFVDPSEIKPFYDKFLEIQSQGWAESNGLNGQVSNIAHALYKLGYWNDNILNSLKSANNNEKCKGVGIGLIGDVFNGNNNQAQQGQSTQNNTIRINRKNLQLKMSTVSSFSNVNGLQEWISQEQIYDVEYDISDDVIDYVFDAAQKEQIKNNIAVTPPTVKTKQATDEIIKDVAKTEEKLLDKIAALEAKMIEAADNSKSKFNMKYVYIGGGILATLVVLKLVFGGKGTKVIS